MSSLSPELNVSTFPSCISFAAYLRKRTLWPSAVSAVFALVFDRLARMR